MERGPCVLCAVEGSVEETEILGTDVYTNVDVLFVDTAAGNAVLETCVVLSVVANTETADVLLVVNVEGVLVLDVILEGRSDKELTADVDRLVALDDADARTVVVDGVDEDTDVGNAVSVIRVASVVDAWLAYIDAVSELVVVGFVFIGFGVVVY